MSVQIEYLYHKSQSLYGWNGCNATHKVCNLSHNVCTNRMFVTQISVRNASHKFGNLSHKIYNASNNVCMDRTFITQIMCICNDGCTYKAWVTSHKICNTSHNVYMCRRIITQVTKYVTQVTMSICVEEL